MDRPEDALLPEGTRKTLSALARLCPVAVVSGRARAEVAALVAIEGIVYAGCHGFDIAGPGIIPPEVRPRVEWDKGRAVLWLLQALGLDRPGVAAIYVGDDLTDEDVFAALDYLRQLPDDLYVVAGKILMGEERLRPGWAVQGTTGYDFLNAVGAVLVEPGSRTVLADVYSRFTGAGGRFSDVVWSTSSSTRARSGWRARSC